MANFGLSKPWIAKYSAGKYTDAFQCGKAINTTVTPNTVSAALFADNQQVEDVNEFSNATVVLGVNTIPAQAPEVLFGHKAGTTEGEEVSNTGDSGSYVGYGFVVASMDAGVKKYQACFLHKVKFAEGEESYQTKGDQITFVTPSLSGTAYGDENGDWRTKSPLFATEAEADKWVQKKLGVAEA